VQIVFAVTIAPILGIMRLDRQGDRDGQIRFDQSSPQNRHSRPPFRLWWIVSLDLCRVTRGPRGPTCQSRGCRDPRRGKDLGQSWMRCRRDGHLREP